MPVPQAAVSLGLEQGQMKLATSASVGLSVEWSLVGGPGPAEAIPPGLQEACRSPHGVPASAVRTPSRNKCTCVWRVLEGRKGDDRTFRMRPT